MPQSYPKFTGKIAIILVTALFVMLGCSLFTPVSTNQQAPTSGPTAPEPIQTEVGEPPATENEAEEAEVQLVEGMDAPAPLEFPSLGSIVFQADPDAAVSGESTAQDPLELKVRDATGLTWTLSLPPGALEPGQKVTMTTLTGLQSENIDSLVGGILLEPDGVDLRVPGQLTVTGPGLGEHGLVLSGSQDGAQVNFSVQGRVDQGAGAVLSHFSSYFANNPDEQDADEAEQSYQEAVKQARALLKQPIKAPVPPDSPLECTTDEKAKENAKSVEKFIQEANHPEGELVGQLMALRSTLAKAGRTQYNSIGDVEARLLKRQVRKVGFLIAQYKNQELKYTPIVQFALKVVYQLQLIGEDRDNTNAVMEKIAVWSERLIYQLIDDISVKHEYNKLKSVPEMTRSAQLLGKADDLDGVIDKLESALKFKIEIKFDLNYPKEHWVTESTGSVRILRMEFTSGSASGQGTYTTATSEGAKIIGEPFDVSIQIKDFDPCAETFLIGFDRFGSTETYDIDGDIVKSMPLVQNSGQSLFGDFASGGLYLFQMPLTNGSATAAHQSFQNSKFGKIDGTLEITVTHMP